MWPRCGGPLHQVLCLTGVRSVGSYSSVHPHIFIYVHPSLATLGTRHGGPVRSHTLQTIDAATVDAGAPSVPTGAISSRDHKPLLVIPRAGWRRLPTTSLSSIAHTVADLPQPKPDGVLRATGERPLDQRSCDDSRERCTRLAARAAQGRCFFRNNDLEFDARKARAPR